MSEIAPIAAADRRAKRAFAVRMKHVTGVLTTAAYAVLGGAVWEPLFHSQRFQAVHYLFACVGVAMIFIAVYIVPMGEVDHDRL